MGAWTHINGGFIVLRHVTKVRHFLLSLLVVNEQLLNSPLDESANENDYEIRLAYQ